MPSIHTSEEFNKQVVQVWTERAGFTGYQALDFTRLDDLEAYSSGIFSQTTGLSLSTNSLLTQAIALNTTASSLDSKIYATGDNWPNGVKGTIVFQSDLSAQFDNVDIAGYAGADISGIQRNTADITGIYRNTQQGIPTFQQSSSGISNFTPSAGTGIAINGNANRKELYIQNLSTGTLYVKYGVVANSSSFNFILAGCTANNIGDGGSIADQGYNGHVSVSGFGGPANYIAWERT